MVNEYLLSDLIVRPGDHVVASGYQIPGENGSTGQLWAADPMTPSEFLPQEGGSVRLSLRNDSPLHSESFAKVEGIWRGESHLEAHSAIAISVPETYFFADLVRGRPFSSVDIDEFSLASSATTRAANAAGVDLASGGSMEKHWRQFLYLTGALVSAIESADLMIDIYVTVIPKRVHERLPLGSRVTQ